MFARFLGGVIFWFGATVSVQAAVSIEFKAAAIQNTITLPLGDLVEISADEALRKKILRDVAVPGKGRVGDTVIYTRSEIEQLINTTHPESSAQLRWSGPERILVQRRGITIAPQEYIDRAGEQLQAHWAAHSGRFVLKPANDYRELAIPNGVYSLSARFDGDTVRRTTKVWLDVAVDKQYYTSIAVMFDVRWLHSALVLNERGSARQHLTAAMVRSAEVDISLIKGAVLEDVRQLLDQRLRHDVAAGVPLSAGDIEAKPAIELGDTVQVYTKVGRVAVQTQAIAQRDGFIGERIDVKNPHSNEQLTVDVIGEHLAAVSDNQKH